MKIINFFFVDYLTNHIDKSCEIIQKCANSILLSSVFVSIENH